MSRKIKFDTRNFNRHTPEGMELLEKSISEVGAIESVTVDAEGEIITGNARKETFDKLGSMNAGANARIETLEIFNDKKMYNFV